MADAKGVAATVPSGRRLTAWMAWLAGAALIATGVLCIGAYVNEVAEVWGSSDRSSIYWLSFLPAVGMTLIGAGGWFAVIGFRAHQGDPAGITAARYSLAALAVLVAIGLLTGHVREQRWAKETRERAQAESLHNDRLRHARRIESLELDIVDNRRLAIRTGLTDGLDGSYRWTLRLSSHQAVFHEESQLMRLQGRADPLTRELAFDAVFADCFTGQPSPAYVCVKGGGAEDIYTVSASLELIEDARGGVSAYERRHDPIASTAATDLEIDTMTTPHAVIVEHVREF